MFYCLLVVFLAMLWLLYETDCLMIRLPCGKPNKAHSVKLLMPAFVAEILMLPAPKIANPVSSFKPCDINNNIESKTVINIMAKIL